MFLIIFFVKKFNFFIKTLIVLYIALFDYFKIALKLFNY